MSGVLLSACATIGATGHDPSGASAATADPGLVDIRELAPGVHTQIRYATTDNFLGAVVDGYASPRCLLTRPAATALAALQAELEEFDLSLLFYDCFRPQRAVDHFVRWSMDPADQTMKVAHYPNVPKERLFDLGYIARRSGHSRGSTVDLTLCDAAGEPLDMGSPWDFLDPLSHTASAALPPAARRNRLLLRALMEKHGFRNYDQEWWHYTLVDEPWPDRYFDLEIR